MYIDFYMVQNIKMSHRLWKSNNHNVSTSSNYNDLYVKIRYLFMGMQALK